MEKGKEPVDNAGTEKGDKGFFPWGDRWEFVTGVKNGADRGLLAKQSKGKSTTWGGGYDGVRPTE